MDELTAMTLFDSLTPKERAVFFVEMMNCGDVRQALLATLKDFTTHEAVELFIGPASRVIIGTDFVEDGDVIHIYSDSVETIDGYVKELMENGEILETVRVGKRKKLFHRQMLSVNSFADEGELLPIIYN